MKRTIYRLYPFILGIILLLRADIRAETLTVRATAAFVLFAAAAGTGMGEPGVDLN